MRGGVAVGVAQVGIALIQLVSIPILSRLLGPTEFGLIAMSMVFTGFASMFIDAGLSTATLQRKEINHGQVSNLFWISSGLGLVAMVVMMSVSPFVAGFYQRAELVGITIALSIPFLLSGLGLQPIALLRRSMQYNTLSRIEVVSSLGGALTAIVYAWFFQNYWALVAQSLAVAFLRSTQAWLAVGWRPSLPQRGVGTRDMVQFGVTVFLSSMVNYVAQSADKLLIGYLAGANVLGLYERAQRLLQMPLQKLNGPMSSVMIPTLSRLNSEPNQYRQAYDGAATILLSLIVPFAAVAVVAPRACVMVVFGPGWEEMIPLFQILAIAAIAMPIFNSLSWLLISQGRAKTLLAMLSGEGVGRIALLAASSLWGALGIATMATARLFIGLPFMFLIVGNHETYAAKSLYRILLISLASFTITSACIAPLTLAFSPDTSAVVLLGVLIPCALAVSLLVLVAFPATRFAGRRVLGELARLRHKRKLQQPSSHTT